MTRLIDADALDAEMYHKSFEVDDGRNVWNSGLWIRYKIFEEAIRDAPTLDAVPVKHGMWVDGKTENIKTGEVRFVRKCSECGSGYFIYDSLNSVDEIPKYCPNCGAKMDGKGEE